jgi:hypothetical protein
MNFPIFIRTLDAIYQFNEMVSMIISHSHPANEIAPIAINEIIASPEIASGITEPFFIRISCDI